MEKNKKSRKKGKNIGFKLISILLVLSFIGCLGFLIYFEILPVLYLSIAIIFGSLIIYILFKILNNKKLKKYIKVIISIPSVLLSIIFILVCFYSFGTVSFFNNIVDMGIRNDSYSVYVLNDSKYDKIRDLDGEIIGIIDEENNDKVIKKLSKKIDYNMANYSDNIEALDDLESKDINAVVLLDSTVDLLKDESDDYDNIRPVYNFNITSKVKTNSKGVNVSKENFVLYISGIDTKGKVDSKARSDVNILVAVNPNKNKVLLINTPRDFYVKLKTKNKKDKLTHAGVYGIEESIGSLEDLYDIKINYYIRVNFTTFVNIVDTLDGINVDVPVSFCEQDSNRRFGANEICLRKGPQELSGEEALALARTRHTLARGDRDRINNQMLVLEGIIDKAISPKIIVKYNTLLNKLSDSVITNMDQKSFTRLIKKQIKNNVKWDIEMYSTDGYDSSNTTYSNSSSKVYVMEPKEETVTEAKVKLDKVLETKKYTTTKKKDITK